MRVNITVTFDLVEDAFASGNSVDQAELAASGMSPDEIAGALVESIQQRAAKLRGKSQAWPKPQPQPDAKPEESKGGDYPVDPDQD